MLSPWTLLSGNCVWQQRLEPIVQIPHCISPYHTMDHFVTEMCTHVHISLTKWCNVGYLCDWWMTDSVTQADPDALKMALHRVICNQIRNERSSIFNWVPEPVLKRWLFFYCITSIAHRMTSHVIHTLLSALLAFYESHLVLMVSLHFSTWSISAEGESPLTQGLALFSVFEETNCWINSRRWFETPRHSCDATVISGLTADCWWACCCQN